MSVIFALLSLLAAAIVLLALVIALSAIRIKQEDLAAANQMAAPA